MINKITHLSNILLDIEIFHFNIIKDQQNQNIKKNFMNTKNKRYNYYACFVLSSI